MVDIIKELQTLLENRGYSKRTIKSYVSRVNDLQDHFYRDDIASLDLAKVGDYIKSLTSKRKLSASTTKQAIAALNFLYNELLNKFFDFKPYYIKWIEREVPDIPTQEEIFAIINNIKSKVSRCAISIIYSMGLELNEALNIKIKDINLKKSLIVIPLQRKRGYREAIIAGKDKNLIKDQMSEKKTTDYLFTIKGDDRCSDSAIQKSFAKAMKIAGIDKKYTIRSLRYSYIKHLELSGVPLKSIVTHLGLSSTLSLDFYCRIVSPETTVKFSPADRLIIEAVEYVINDPYVSDNRIADITQLSQHKYDLIRLLELLRELNLCHQNKCLMSIAMIVRTIINHIPPVFGCKTFDEVVNNYSSGKSFKSSTAHLNNSLRNIADMYLHVPVRQKESLPSFVQIDFRADLDVLLGEIVRILR